MSNKPTIGILLSAVLMVCGADASAQMLNREQLNVLLERARQEGIPQDVALQRIVEFERSHYGAPQMPQQTGPTQEELLLQELAQQQAQMQRAQPGVAGQIGNLMTDEALRVMSTLYHNELVRSGVERGYDYRRDYDRYDHQGSSYGQDYPLDPKAEALMRVLDDARNMQYRRRYNGR